MPTSDSSVLRWLREVGLPWSNIPKRWSISEVQAKIHQIMMDASGQALREWWAATARPAGLATWARTVRRPKYDSETATEHRRRVAGYRSEGYGNSKWIRDEVARITGYSPARVIEIPREGLRLGFSPLGSTRLGTGPFFTIGADPQHLAEVKATIEPAVSPRVGINYLAPDVFNAVRYGPDGPPSTPVPPVSGPPTANAGADAWGVWGNTIALSGSAAPAAGRSIVARQWTQTAGATVALTGANTDAPSFTAPNTDDTLTFRYTVIDDAGESATDDVTVEIGVQAGQFAAPTGRRIIFDASVVRGPFAVQDAFSYFRLPENNQGGLTNITIGRLRDGSLTVSDGTNSTDITRVFYVDSNGDLGIQDHPHTGDVGTIIGPDAELHITTAAGTTMTMTITTDDEDGSGTQFYRWNTTTAQQTAIEAIVIGRSFAVAVSIPE